MNTSEILTKSSHDGQPTLNTSETRTKSSHGGKRPGAGRPRSDQSIRAQLEEGTTTKANHSYTRYEVWTGMYLSKHAHVLVTWLSLTPNKAERHAFTRDKMLMSRACAFRIAHLPKKDQPFHLYLWFANLLSKAAQQYWEDPSDINRGYARWCAICLRDEGAITLDSAAR
jgi:hypothetical protein